MHSHRRRSPAIDKLGQYIEQKFDTIEGLNQSELGKCLNDHFKTKAGCQTVYNFLRQSILPRAEVLIFLFLCCGYSKKEAQRLIMKCLVEIHKEQLEVAYKEVGKYGAIYNKKIRSSIA